MTELERDYIASQAVTVPKPVVYEQGHHLEMIRSWDRTVRIEPRLLGNGLVVEGVCSGFMDPIGKTKCALFYGLIANPLANMNDRFRAMISIARSLGDQAKALGLTEMMTTTHMPGVESLWAAQGILPTGDKVLAGRIK